MKKFISNYYYFLIIIASLVFHIYWLGELSIGDVPGPVDPFLKTLQGYSLFNSNFTDQSIYYQFRDIDPNFEFCFFQKDIFTFRFENSLLGPFPVSLSALVALLLYVLPIQNVFIFFALLNLILYLVIFKKVKQDIAIVILIFFGLPFFIPNSEVSEHSLLIFTEILSYFLIHKFLSKESENGKKYFIFLAGVSLGLGIFFRHEILLFGNLFLCSLFVFKFIPKYKNIIRWKEIFLYFLGLYLTFILFFVMNKYMYGSSVGPRLNANSSGIYSDLFNKFVFYKSILWKEGSNFGLFGYNPIYIITLLISIVYIRHWNAKDILYFLPTLGLIFIVPPLAPNDGGSPWGARYLFLTIFPLVMLTSRSLHFLSLSENKYYIWIFRILIIFSVIQTTISERRSLKAAKEVSIQQKNYISETAVEEADLIIFTSELIAMQTGINYIKFPSILVNHENKIPSLRQKILFDKNKFKKIVIVEPILDNINLSKFSESDLAGIKPSNILSYFDKNFEKMTIERKKLVILHHYINQ
ncbi:MAG: hypothetical protein SH817_12600 [Leptospira sp.]|nr:hypothetical protein [Leptospira sp.]